MRDRSLELERFEDSICQTLADLELFTYYQLLDLPPEGSCAIAQYNYNVKAYEYGNVQKDHRCSAALYQALSLLLERLEEARHVLSDPALRAEYDRGLEDGHTRLERVVRERAAQRKGPPRDERLEVLELLSARLQRTIHAEDLHAPEEVVPDVSDGIEADLLDQQSQVLEGELAAYGVTIDVTAEAPAPAPQAIEQEYLEKAALHLRREIYRDGATLHEVAEPEDLSASDDPALVSGLTEQLHRELETMGVPEKEEVEPEALPLDAETVSRLAWQEQQAVLELKVDTTVRQDQALHADVVDQATADRLAAQLSRDLGRMGVDYAPPPPDRPSPIPLPIAPEPEPILVPLDPELVPVEAEPLPAPPPPPVRSEERRPSAELEPFDLVIPIEDETKPPR